MDMMTSEILEVFLIEFTQGILDNFVTPEVEAHFPVPVKDPYHVK